MKINGFGLVFILICLHTFQVKAQNQWTKLNDFSGYKREKAVAFSIQETGYLATGVDTAEQVHNDLWAYHPETDSWEQKADLPADGRRNAVAFVIENKAYVGTGINHDNADLGDVLDDFWQYEPLNNSWTQMADYPGYGGLGLYYATGFSIGDKGYICGGKKGPNDYTDEMWEYNAEFGYWIQKADFPGGDRYQLSSFVIDEQAFVGLGTDHDVYQNDFWAYSPSTDAWVQKTDFPAGGRACATAFQIQQRGFICLGTDGGLKKDLLEYNPFNDSWTVRADFEGSARKHAVSFVINQIAYVGTGKGESGKKASFYSYQGMPVLNTVHNSINGFHIYPNPVNNMLYFTPMDDLNEIKWYSLDGQLIKISPAQQASTTVTDMPNGFYLIILVDSKNQILHQAKICVSH